VSVALPAADPQHGEPALEGSDVRAPGAIRSNLTALPRRPTFWLFLIVAAFVAVSVYSGVTAYWSLRTQAFDLSIFRQSFASTAQGFRIPFYESIDCAWKDRCSFLLVHPSFILYPLVPLYAAFPTPLTLFVVQSMVVGCAAFPLYALTRTVTGSTEKAFIAAGLFLAWAPTLAAQAFSFHVESFLPLEFFSVAALWVTRSYRLALGAAFLSFVTIEDAPVFTFLIAVFFLAPPLAALLRGVRSDRALPAGARWSTVGFRHLSRTARSAWRQAEIRCSLVLAIASVVAYVLLYAFLNDFGARILGVASPSVPPGISGLFYSNSTHASSSLGTIIQSPTAGRLLEFWILVYALVGFVPLLSPRTLIVALPWIAFTFATLSPGFGSLESHTSMITAFPVFFGLAYGLKRIPAVFGNHLTKRAARISFSTGFTRVSAKKVGWAIVLSAVLAANLLLNPINPLLASSNVVDWGPVGPGYFHTTPGPIEDFGTLRSIAELVPAGATVGAPPPFFELIANDVNAVCIGCPGVHYGNLPINVSGGLSYVFLDPRTATTDTAQLRLLMPQPRTYGPTAYVESSPVGPVILYERGYHGRAVLIGQSEPAPTAQHYVPGHGLAPAAHGLMLPDPNSPSGYVIRSLPSPTLPSNVWQGPGTYLPPGVYSVSALVQLASESSSPAVSSNAFGLQVRGLTGILLSESFGPPSIAPGAWAEVNISFSLSGPLVDFQVVGVLDTQGYALEVAALSVAAVGG
jgi:uncharacterized membrane protein